MNRKAQQKEIWGIISAFFGVILIIVFLSFLPSIFCTDEKAQIERLSGDLGICQSKIQNQTILTQTLNDQCDQRVNQSIQECNGDLKLNIDIVNSYKVIFFIYHLSIALSIILAFNLFKGFLRFEIKVKNRKAKIILKGVRFVWIGIKWILFVGSMAIFLLSLGYLFFPHWFF